MGTAWGLILGWQRQGMTENSIYFLLQTVLSVLLKQLGLILESIEQITAFLCASVYLLEKGVLAVGGQGS